MQSERLDIILFGATGYTGKYALKSLYKLALHKNLKWGIAGRNRVKLETIFNELVTENQLLEPFEVPIIIADLNNNASMIAMTSKARLILNCCGPFRSMGEAVVKACIETGTHHVDVSDENDYMENLQLKYDKKAGEQKIYIASACGLSSIPCDLSAVFLQNKFEGTLNSIETFLRFTYNDHSVNYETWESEVQKKPEFSKRFFPFRMGCEWNVLLPHSDGAVMSRSQRYFHENCKRRPIHIETYYSVASFFNLIILAMIGLFIITFPVFNISRNFIMRKTENIKFSLTVLGKGWDKNEKNFENNPNKAMIVEVKDTNHVYGVSCTCAVLAAIVILTEQSNLPSRGGVYSPGALFEKTTLIEQLNENGIEMKLIKTFDI